MAENTGIASPKPTRMQVFDSMRTNLQHGQGLPGTYILSMPCIHLLEHGPETARLAAEEVASRSLSSESGQLPPCGRR